MSDSQLAKTHEQLYGPRASVHDRWPTLATRGEIWEQIDTCYEKKVEFRQWFLENGDPSIRGSVFNPRSIASAQRKYCKRILADGYDPEGRGTPQGTEGDMTMQTDLLGGKQLALAFYMAHSKQPNNPNVQRALALGYQVCMRPKSMPRDVMEQIVKHSNLNNKGVKDTLPERVLLVPTVEAAFKDHLEEKHIDPKSLPTKGDYTYHKL